MRMFISSGLIAVVSWMTVDVQAAELISDERRVTEFSDSSNLTFTPDSPFGSFNNSYQNTFIGETEFSGSGSGVGDSDFNFFIAESFFDVTFAVNEDTPFSLTGSLEVEPGTFGFAQVSVKLYRGAEIDTATTIYEAELDTDFGAEQTMLALDEMLTPDTYRFVIDTAITPGGFGTLASYSFDVLLTEPEPDSDGDGLDDSVDNCLLVANADQTDFDNDGYGDICDADFNNDCIVNFLDIAPLSAAFLNSDELYDLNNDGAVNFLDYSLATSVFLLAPGPSNVGDCPVD